MENRLAGGVLLLDTIGELAALYALADVAFVGGSLVPRGGHNIIEPAQHGVAIVVGNHTENFRDIVSLFQSRDAVRIVGPVGVAAGVDGVAGERCGADGALGRRAPRPCGRRLEHTDARRARCDICEELLARIHESLNPLSAIYGGGGASARNALYDRGWLRSRSLQGG